MAKLCLSKGERERYSNGDYLLMLRLFISEKWRNLPSILSFSAP